MGKKRTSFDYEHYDETLDFTGALDEYELEAAAYEVIPDLESNKNKEKRNEDIEDDEDALFPLESTAVIPRKRRTKRKRKPSPLEVLTLDENNDRSNYRIDDDEVIDAEDVISDSEDTNETSFAYPLKYIKELMDLYQKGDDETKNHVTEEFLVMLTPLVRSTIRRKRGTGSEFPDYIQHCYMYIKMRISNYDPEKSSPFNYFKYIIIEAISNYYDDSHGISGFYSSIDRKVRKIMRTYEASQLRVTPSKIAQEVGITVRQAEDSLACISGSDLVYEEDMTTHDKDHFNPVTPEDVIVQQESEDLLNYAIECLSFNEQTALRMSYGLTEDHISYSNKAISEVLHVSESKVKELLSTAKRRLRNDYALDQLRGNSIRISKRKDGIYDSDPALYSFDPSCDEYAFLDLDDDDVETSDVPPTESSAISSISFSDY